MRIVYIWPLLCEVCKNNLGGNRIFVFVCISRTTNEINKVNINCKLVPVPLCGIANLYRSKLDDID